MSGKRDLFIGGQWVSAKNKATFPVYNPSTGEVWAQIADAGRSDATAAIEAAAAAQPEWAALRALQARGAAVEGRRRARGPGQGIPGRADRRRRRVDRQDDVRDRLQRRRLPRRRRGRVSSHGRDPAVRSRQAEPRRARAARRRLGHLAVEFPADSVVARLRRRARRRQHRRAQAVRGDARFGRPADRRGSRGSRHSEGRVQRRHLLARQRRRSRRRADLEPDRARHQLHGLHRGRHARSPRRPADC